MILTERNCLAVLLLLYLAASLLHFVHNAEFLSDYPNLPAWLTRSQVYPPGQARRPSVVGGLAIYFAVGILVACC